MKTNWIYPAGTVYFFVLLWLSILLYQERTIIFDPAFHLFSIVRTGKFAIQVNRFGAFFTQLFPLLAVKLGLPLKAVAIGYSASFVVLDALLFALLLRPLRQPVWALALLVNSILMVNQTFYWIQSELKQGLSILLFYFGMMQSGRPKSGTSWFLPVHAALLFLLAFTHPLLLFPAVFGMALLARQAAPEQRRRWLSIGATFLLFYLIKSQLFRNWYDDAQMEHLGNLVTRFPHYFSVPTNALFFNYLVNDYYFLIPVFAGVVYALAAQKKFPELAWYLLFCTGYLLLVNVTYPEPENLRHFYSEQFYLPLGAMTLIMAAFLLESGGPHRWLPVAVALILLVRLPDVYAQHHYFTQKIAWQRRFMQAQTRDKVIYHEKDVPESKQLLYTWGSAEEFWLLSTLELGETRSILICDDAEPLRKYTDRKDLFITKHKVFDYADLPAQYFVFRDSASYFFEE